MLLKAISFRHKVEAGIAAFKLTCQTWSYGTAARPKVSSINDGRKSTVSGCSGTGRGIFCRCWAWSGLWSGEWVEERQERTDPESLVWLSLHPHEAERRPPDLQRHQTPPHRWQTCDYLPLHPPSATHRSLLQHHFEPPRTHFAQHVAWFKSPAAENKKKERRQMSNIKHTDAAYCTYTADRPDLQQSLLRPNMWKATCVQGPAAWCCTCFQATSNEIGSASQCSPSFSFLFFFLSWFRGWMRTIESTEKRKRTRERERERESNWFPGRPFELIVRAVGSTTCSRH